jgi:hypothetical protein
MTVEVPLLPPGERRVPTFYTVHGDLFGWACAGLAVLALIAAFFRKQ